MRRENRMEGKECLDPHIVRDGLVKFRMLVFVSELCYPYCAWL